MALRRTARARHGERLGAPDDYGSDRVFVHVRLASEADATNASGLDALADRGHPVLRIDVADAMDLGAEFMRWEVATAAAGSVLGINPFDHGTQRYTHVSIARLRAVHAATHPGAALTRRGDEHD